MPKWARLRRLGRAAGPLAFLLLPFGVIAQQTPGPSTPLPLDPQVKVGTLPNGLRYYIRANQRPEKRAELRLVVNAGSVLEENDQRGLAHFVEHMAFNGTRTFKRQELVGYLESIGMRFGPDLNAYTGFDETVYMLTIPTDSQRVVATAFQIMEDWASGLLLDAADIDAERGVVIEEWRGRLGAQARLTDKQLPVMLRGSRYADRLPIGLRETLETFPREALVRFYQRWYRPDLMAVVAVGDFDPAQVESLIREHFERVPKPAAAAQRPAYPVPAHQETLFLTATDPELTTTQVELMHKQPVRLFATLGDYRRSLVEQLFNGMLNSRFTEITQKPNAPFLGAYSGRGSLVRTAEAFSLGATVPEGGAQRGLEALLLEAERVERHGFTGSELARIKTNLLRSLERAYAERERTNSGSYADEYVRHFLEAEASPGIAFEYQTAQSLLPTIQLAELNSLASEWLAEENRLILVSAPEKAGVPVPGEADLRRLLAAADAAQVEPYQDTVVEQPLVAQPPAPAAITEERRLPADLLEWRLANGVRVILKSTDFRDDEVVMNAFAPGGLSLASDADVVSATFAADLVRVSGIGAFNLVELQRALTGKAASAAPFLSELEQGLSGSASPSDLETLFQLVYLYFTAPRLDTDAAAAMTERLRAVLTNRSADPAAAFADTLQATLSSHHPRYPAPTLGMLQSLDAARAIDFYRARFSDASGFTFVLMGNLDLEAVRPLVQTYLGGLPSTRRGESWRDTGVRPPVGVVERTVRQGLEPRAQTQLVFTGPLPYTRETRYALRALSDMLELRLHEVLREDMGGTYGVQVLGSSVSKPEPRYTLNIAFGSAPEQLDPLVAALFQEVERLKTEGPSEADLGRVKEIQRRERETSLRQNGYWLGQVSGYAREGLDFADLLRYEQLVEGLNAEQIREAARTLLETDNYIRVSLLPAR